jgi:hypothetical protein
MAPASSDSDRTTRIPLPPPPAEALITIGIPMPARCSGERSCEPGTTGTPAAFIRSREGTFSPIASIAAGGGPIQTSPASRTARANAAFSERNPNPG